MVVCVKNINEACYGKTIMWYSHLSFDKGMGFQLETAGTYSEWEVGTEEERRGGQSYVVKPPCAPPEAGHGGREVNPTGRKPRGI